ncbi:hypothetical protein C8Q75DRAFT_804892 [Abortiporus biennis]|nr:hypothetical protein C8Q75DRAFT_804892 [Abortiporus biennis]
MQSSRLRVAIVGGGIGGLTMALAISRCAPDIDVDIYESASSFGEIGAGIGMWPRVWETMQFLGLEEDLKRIIGTPHASGIQYRKSDQSEGIAFGSNMIHLQTIHRAEFLEILVDRIPSSYGTHFSKRLTSYVDGDVGPVTMFFKDGSSATCDLLIGADGIKSQVRETMYISMAEIAKKNRDPPENVDRFRDHTKCVWTGQLIYRYLIPSEDLERVYPGHPCLKAPAQFHGKNKFIIGYPISRGKFINVAAIIFKPEYAGSTFHGSWSTYVPHRELIDQFVDWEPQARCMINLMKRPSRWAVNCVPSLPAYHFRRVALLGDSAHAMTPHQGSGAGQAAEDALVMSSLLGRPEITRQTLHLALQVYDEIRRPVSQRVQQTSDEAGLLYSFNNVDYQYNPDNHVTSMDSLKRIHGRILDLFKWTWTTSAFEDRDRAMKILTDRLKSSRV